MQIAVLNLPLWLFLFRQAPARPPMRLLTGEKTQRFMSFRCLPSVKTLQRAGMGLPLPSKHLKPLAVMDGAAPRFNKYQQRPLPFQGSCFRSGQRLLGGPAGPAGELRAAGTPGPSYFSPSAPLLRRLPCASRPSIPRS